MAKCTAKCYWIDYEAKQPEHFTYSINVRATQDIPGTLMPSPEEFSAVIQEVLDEYNGREMVAEEGECEEGCSWEMLGNDDVPWTPWRRIPFKRTLTKETESQKIEFEVSGELEVRKRILEGVCIERKL